jgi:hypothetical protein
MTATIPQHPMIEQGARLRRCPICDTPPGTPCQAKPAADHLGRFLDAYTAGQLSREYLSAVVGKLVVITTAQLITGGAR